MGVFITEKRSIHVTVLCLIFFFLTSCLMSKGEVYKVGDAAGWTTRANVDYRQWSVSKNFQLGDIIVFSYNPQFHNVMQVTHADYHTCNTSSPISIHTTGNDSIPITTRGHHFFLCGVPGHCQAGQKVDINVLRAPSVAPSPSTTPEVTGVSPPAPSPSGTTSHFSTNMVFGIASVVIAVFFSLW